MNDWSWIKNLFFFPKKINNLKSQEEAGRYLETYKSFEYKPPDMIMEKVQDDYLSRVIISNVKYSWY